MAWLRAIPEEKTQSRWADYTVQEMEAPLPDITGYEYLVQLLESAGTILQTGTGIAPLNWIELESWERKYSEELNCWELSFWEFNTIKDLSYAYCAELGNASDKKRPSPFKAPEIDREDVSRRIRNAFMAFKLK